MHLLHTWVGGFKYHLVNAIYKCREVCRWCTRICHNASTVSLNIESGSRKSFLFLSELSCAHALFVYTFRIYFVYFVVLLFSLTRCFCARSFVFFSSYSALFLFLSFLHLVFLIRLKMHFKSKCEQVFALCVVVVATAKPINLLTSSPLELADWGYLLCVLAIANASFRWKLVFFLQASFVCIKLYLATNSICSL